MTSQIQCKHCKAMLPDLLSLLRHKRDHCQEVPICTTCSTNLGEYDLLKYIHEQQQGVLPRKDVILEGPPSKEETVPKKLTIKPRPSTVEAGLPEGPDPLPVTTGSVKKILSDKAKS